MKGRFGSRLTLGLFAVLFAGCTALAQGDQALDAAIGNVIVLALVVLFFMAIYVYLAANTLAIRGGVAHGKRMRCTLPCEELTWESCNGASWRGTDRARFAIASDCDGSKHKLEALNNRHALMLAPHEKVVDTILLSRTYELNCRSYIVQVGSLASPKSEFTVSNILRLTAALPTD